MRKLDARHAAALLLIAMPLASVANASTPTASAPEAVDSQVRAFFDLLKAGKSTEAVEGLMKTSPIWSAKPGTREAILGQIDAATRAYGPITGYEKISTDATGTMAIRERYFVQHRDMVTRWEIDFLRTGSGWAMGYFGFADTPQNWFPTDP
jgi:hypothetical protein